MFPLWMTNKNRLIRCTSHEPVFFCLYHLTSKRQLKCGMNSSLSAKLNGAEKPPETAMVSQRKGYHSAFLPIVALMRRTPAEEDSSF